MTAQLLNKRGSESPDDGAPIMDDFLSLRVSEVATLLSKSICFVLGPIVQLLNISCLSGMT